MEDLNLYRALLRERGPVEFQETFAGSLYLVKPPRTAIPPSEPPVDEPISSRSAYRTTQVDVGAGAIDLHDVFGADMCFWKIAKKPGNPFPDRVSIGRAPNCDICLRVPYLSKLHAHFHLDAEGGVSLADARSSNGTRLNGFELQTNEQKIVKSGDRISFGAVRVIVVDAEKLCDFLRSPRSMLPPSAG